MMKKSLIGKLMQVSLTVLLTVRPFSVFAEEAEPETEVTYEQERTEEETAEEQITEEDSEEPETAQVETETEEVPAVTQEPQPAEQEETEEGIRETIAEVNEVYEDVIREEDLPVSSNRKGLLAAAASETYTDSAVLGEVIREDIKARRTPVSYEIEITLQYEDSSQFDVSGFNRIAMNRMTDEIMDAAMVHTGSPDEGDYIKYEYGGVVYNMSGSVRKNRTKNTVTFIGTLKFTFGYYTDYAQEEETAELITQALDDLDLENDTDIEKIKKIAAYICSAVTYDYEHLEDTTYLLKHTAYAAIHDHTAVCQGYALLFYRMALEAGLEARILSGRAFGDLHAWNIVRIEDRYYLLDCTWDAGEDPSSFSWFLKCPASFPNHATGDDDYNQRVLAQCEITDTDYVPAEGLTLSESSLILADKNEPVSFAVSVVPEEATLQGIMTTSTDPRTAEFADGELQIRGYGETEIVFVTEDGYYTDTLYVRVGEKKELTVYNGSGSGFYYPERETEVIADEPEEGMQFAYWDTDLQPAEGYSVNDAHAVFLMPETDAQMTAVYEAVPETAEFKGHQLVLSGTLGLRFGVVLPEGFDEEGSYMTFTLNGAEQRTETADAPTENGRKIFTCYLNTLQMAEEIQAVFHYPDGRTDSQNYSLTQYLEYFEAHPGSYTEKTMRLIRSIADYGYYAQPYLVSLHHLEGIYAPMTMHYTESYDYEEIRPAVAGYAFAKGISISAVTNASYKLSLDADTAVSVFMQVPAGTELTASVTFAGKTYTAQKESSTVYIIKIPGIKASQLGSTIMVEGYAEGNFTITVSALSYVRSVLNNDTYGEDAKNTVSALYQYYAAVQGY